MTNFYILEHSFFVSTSYKRSKVQCGSRLVLCHSHQSPPPSLPPGLLTSSPHPFSPFLFSSFSLLTLDLLCLTVHIYFSRPHLPQCRDPPSLALQAAVCNTWESWENIGQPQFDFCQTFPCKPACENTLFSYKSLQCGIQLSEEGERTT